MVSAVLRLTPSPTRATRRARAVLLPALIAVAVPLLASCGDDTAPGADTYDRLDAVTITGDVGVAPEVEWKGQMEAGEIESETVVTGEGDELGDKDTVLAHLWIGNGFTQEEAYSSYGEKRAELVTVDDQLAPFLASVKGATVGSRLAVTSSAEAAFGEAGNPSLGIGNKDAVLVIIDLVSGMEEEPTGERSPAPAWMPPIQFKDGNPAGFTYKGVPEPTDELRKAVLLTGSGPKVEKGQTVAVRYVGEVFGAQKPFDENFTTGTPTAFGIGSGQVIKAWDQALVGATVGTRMVIEVPPDLGYGKKGNSSAGIKGTDTLVFLIDVLGAA